MLAVQEATELEFTRHEAVRDLGPIGDGHGRGILQHSTAALDPQGHLFGILHQIWRLLINEALEAFEEVCARVDSYSLRWVSKVENRGL